MTTLDPLRRQAESRIGQVLGGKWKLERLIGIGGMATVYAASHRNGRKGAVKMLHPEMSLNEEAKTRFLREGYAANKVDHPGAVRILDDDVNSDGAVYLVMELLEGDALDELMLKTPGGRIPEAEAVRITIAMLDVLETAHKMEIIHRDLKPDNVFVTKQGSVKILDFGIARVLEQSQNFKTQIGSLLGTPNFMPPEQALGEHDKIDARTDIWATGATMFAMLTGRAVHLGETPNKMLFSAMSQPAPPVRSIAPNVSQAVANVVDKALAFEREKRWSSAAEMRLALKASAASIGASDAAGSGAEGAGAFGPNRTLNMNKDGGPTPPPVSAPQAAPPPEPSSPGASPAQSPAAPASVASAAAAQPRVPDPGTLHRSALASTAPGNKPRPNPLVVGIVAGVVLTTAAVVIWKATSSKPAPSVEAASTTDATETASATPTPAVTSSSPQEAATSAAPESSADVTTSASASAATSASAAPSAAVSTTSSAAPLKGQLPSGAWNPRASASAAPPRAPSAPPPAPPESPPAD